jgi:hypothetical protein
MQALQPGGAACSAALATPPAAAATCLPRAAAGWPWGCAVQRGDGWQWLPLLLGEVAARLICGGGAGCCCCRSSG